MLTITARSLWAHKRRLAGMVLAVVLGVGFLAGALALGDTLSSNFDKLFTTANAGTDAVVRNATTVGTGLTAQRPLIPATLVATVRRVPGVAAAEPTITGYGELIGSDGSGVGGNGPPRLATNWIADRGLNPYRIVEGRAPEAIDEVVVNRGAALAGGLHLGDVTSVQMPARVRVRIVGIATFGTADGLGKATFTAFSLAGAERWVTGRPDEVTSVIARAAPGLAQADLASRIAGVLPPGSEAVTGAGATSQALRALSGQFLTALRTILVVFAGIALLVATFSIVNTFSILVAQRSREAALLRALGGTRRQVLVSVVLEALVLGILASGLGVLTGIGIAGLLKGVFDSFGFALPAGGLVVSARMALVSLVAGMAVTVGAGLVPAVRASRVPPLAALRTAVADRASSGLLRAVAGLALVGTGVGLVITGVSGPASGSGSGVLRLVGLGCVLSAAGVVTLGPVVARAVTGAVGLPIARLRGIPGLLARGNAMRSPRRSAAAATALMVGVAIVTLFTVFAASMKAANARGVSGSFTGDLAVTAPGFGGGGLPPELATAIAHLPGARTATGITTGQMKLAGKNAQVTVLDPARASSVLDLHETAGSVAELRPDQLAVSQRQADSLHWHVGTKVEATLPDGASSPLTVGALFDSRSLVDDYVVPIGLWAPHALQVVHSAIFVKLDPGADVAASRAAVKQITAGYGQPAVDNRADFVKSQGQAITFLLGIVYVLLALAIVIAVLGIANTLSLGIHERTHEIGLLRAVGQTRRQLRSMIRLESVIISLFGVVGGLGLGVFLGWALAEAADRAAGVATFTAPVAQVAVILALGAAAGVLAAIRPARRAARLPVLGAIAAE